MRKLSELKNLIIIDYQIKSKKILGALIFINSLVVLFFFIGELIVDFRPTSLIILTPFLIVTFIFLIAFRLKFNPKLIASGYVLYLYLILEVHLLLTPTNFHVLIHWFPIVFVTAIIVRGVKESLFWLVVILVSNVFNGIYAMKLVGDSYIVSINYIAFIIGGSIFTFAAFSVIYLLYRLPGEAIGKMKDMNESLDSKVKNRTEELVEQNKKLSEYAFINSHLLRAPLSRIMGLCHIVSLDKAEIQKPEVLDALIRSTEELDAIVHDISELLYDGSKFTREEISEMIKERLEN